MVYRNRDNALLVGCALRRAELAALTIEDIQQREGRWVIADMHGKGGRIRTVAVQATSDLTCLRCLRYLSKGRSATIIGSSA